MENIHEKIQHMGDLKAAVTLVGTGASGSLVQALTEYANLFVAGGNGLLVVGGAYLMYRKIKKDKEADLGGRRTEDKE